MQSRFELTATILGHELLWGRLPTPEAIFPFPQLELQEIWILRTLSPLLMVSSIFFIILTAFLMFWAGGVIDSLTVEIRVQHTWNSDLEIFIEHVDTGTRVELSTDNGGNEDGYINTVFDDSAASAIPGGNTVIGVGPFRPEGSLSDFSGELTDGTWRLDIFDDAGGDSGTLEAFSVTFDGTAAVTGTE
jgi:subtilisin-like proprotein convertase family protein